MRYPAEETAARHERILQEASRLFRERGIGGVSLPEIMKAAQLTHGPFYNHFESKEALIAESLKCAMDSKLSAWRTRAGKSGLREFLDEYLSREHCDNPGDACVAPVLAGEIARNPGAKRSFTKYIKDSLSAIKDSLSAISEQLAPEGVQKDEARAEAVRIYVGVVGAVVLARAVDDKALSDEILARTHADLVRGTSRVRSSGRTSLAKRRSKRRRSLASSTNYTARKILGE